MQLVKAGAADYLAKPWDDAKLLATVQNLLELGEAQQQLKLQRRQLRTRWAALHERLQLGGLVAASPAMLGLLELAAPVARSQLPVLVTGPAGSGKERIAELLHRNSARAAAPFVALNCGALPADLIEAELFGAEAGAYTGAQRARTGHVEAARGGTLFLDEVGNLPLAGQAKLLRVLETGRFQRLGSPREWPADVRIVSATNADLPALMKAGLFREDLYYRLNGIELRLPSLRERPEDIEPLAEAFLAGRARLSDAALGTAARARPGRVRCASCATASSGRWCWRKGRRCWRSSSSVWCFGVRRRVAHLEEPSREQLVARGAARGQRQPRGGWVRVVEAGGVSADAAPWALIGSGLVSVHLRCSPPGFRPGSRPTFGLTQSRQKVKPARALALSLRLRVPCAAQNAGAAQNSRRSLRSLCSNKLRESVHESRLRREPLRSCAARRRRGPYRTSARCLSRGVLRAGPSTSERPESAS